MKKHNYRTKKVNDIKWRAALTHKPSACLTHPEKTPAPLQKNPHRSNFSPTTRTTREQYEKKQPIDAISINTRHTCPKRAFMPPEKRPVPQEKLFEPQLKRLS